MTDEEEKKTIVRLEEYINHRMSAGATEQELDKLFDDLTSLKMNYYTGQLLTE